MKETISKKCLLGLIICSIQITGISQDLMGKVQQISDNGTLTPLMYVMIQWKGSSVGTVTDSAGAFSIRKIASTDTLIVSYSMYQPDTIFVPKNQYDLSVILSTVNNLDAVTVTAQGGMYVSVKPILTTVLTTEGLRRAACCNLSESFESTVSVDVEYSDAVTGARQIAMLGLAGVYSQVILENVPFIRLLSNQFGLAFVPGTWMESISISKGVASVTNGYEAITGQINVDYKKPETNRERLFVNLFGNSMGKGELNMNTRFDVGNKERASSLFLFHSEGQFARMDMNKDGFMDIPCNYQVTGMNRWDFNVPKKYNGRTWVSYLWEERIGGQMEFHPNNYRSSDSVYGFECQTHKVDFVTKNGFLLKGDDESIGSILAFTFHDNNAFFGVRKYRAKQISGYLNLLYSNRYGKKKRSKFTTGISVQYDGLVEKLEREVRSEYETSRSEAVPGVYAEYSYTIDNKITIMPGLRFDYNIFYSKLFWTPRLHIKWQVAKHSIFRISAGKGYRIANVIAENISLLVSNRCLRSYDAVLQPEEAYNAGISFVQTFSMRGGESSFSMDYYYTHFINQTIIDVDQSVNEIAVYNLNGSHNGYHNKSYSHSFQTELIMYPITRFEITLAYRYNLVYQTTAGILQSKALMIPHKALLNLSYATKFDKWKFNVTLQYNSSTRLPDLSGHPEQYRMGHYSPDYCIMNAQVTKKFRGWELYVGGENLFNYKQKNPILSSDDPFGDDFDASIIYAPITGAMAYLGVRWIIK